MTECMGLLGDVEPAASELKFNLIKDAGVTERIEAIEKMSFARR